MLQEESKSAEDDVTPGSSTPTCESEEQRCQEARAFLRERFLRAITGIVGKKCEFQMHKYIKVSAEFGGCDSDIENVYVTDLETPLGVLPQALLRTTDIITMEVKDFASTQRNGT